MGLVKFILAIILFLAILIWDIVTDYRKWKEDKTVKHRKEFWIRILLLLPSIIGFTALSPLKWWISLVLVSIMEGFTFMLLFDGIYNKLRGKDFWYAGSEEPDDASTDDFFQRIGRVKTILFKTIPTAISIFLYIYFL